MARYYEGDTLIEFVKNNTPHINGETTLECVERAIRKTPAADVVSKSEVDRLEQAYNARLAKDIETNADFIKYIKREVARVIFEEIEEFLKRTCERGYCGSISDLFAELKKKRIKDCSTCKHLVSCEPNTTGDCSCWESDSEIEKKYTEENNHD